MLPVQCLGSWLQPAGSAACKVTCCTCPALAAVGHRVPMHEQACDARQQLTYPLLPLLSIEVVGVSMRLHRCMLPALLPPLQSTCTPSAPAAVLQQQRSSLCTAAATAQGPAATRQQQQQVIAAAICGTPQQQAAGCCGMLPASRRLHQQLAVAPAPSSLLRAAALGLAAGLAAACPT